MARGVEAGPRDVCHVSIALELISNIGRCVAQAKRNVDDGKALERLAWKIVPFLHKLGSCEANSGAEAALSLLVEALRAAETAVEESCNRSLFISMLFAGRHYSMLKWAAGLLGHALSNLPLSAIARSAELQESLVFLKMELLGALFSQTAAMKQQMLILKSQIEKEFQRFSEEVDVDRLLLTQLTREYVHSTKDLRRDLEVLKRYTEDAKPGNGRASVDVFDVSRVIGVVTTFILEPALLSKDRQEKQNQPMRCPMSKEPMKDPVILKGSGVTYDRECIVKWMRSGKRRDPLTETEIKCGQLLVNPNPNPNVDIKRLVTKTADAAKIEVKRHYILSKIRSQFTKKLKRSSSDNGRQKMSRSKNSSLRKTEDTREAFRKRRLHRRRSKEWF